VRSLLSDNYIDPQLSKP